MKKFKLIWWIPILCWVGFYSGRSQAFELSAGVREYFTAIGRNGYGSDAAAKMKMSLTGIGVSSLTLHTRLGVASKPGGLLYLPMLKSSKQDLEIMISRIFQGNAAPILKPMIHETPTVGTPVAIPELSAPSDEVFTSYVQSLEPYFSLLNDRSIQEFVLGAGMGEYLKPRYLKRWKLLLDYLESRSMGRTIYSLELSNERALQNLEAAYLENPADFMANLKGFTGVRFTLPAGLILDSKNLTLDEPSLKGAILDRISRIRALFSKAEITYSNVFLPACPGFMSQESEVECTSAKIDFDAQSLLLKNFLAALSSLPPLIAKELAKVELMMASTQDEPLPLEADPRFLITNPKVKPVLQDWLKREVHGSTPFLSPARSSFQFFKPNDGKKHACIYFDEADTSDSIGAVHARMIDNLVGAFPGWEKERRTLGAFRVGDLEDCDRVFYLASNFSLKIPEAFLEGIEKFSQSHPVAWLNYKFEDFFDHYHAHEASLGLESLAFHVPGFIQPDQTPTPTNPDPGFYKVFHYQGETFEKTARFDPVTHLFSASPELGGIQLLNPDRVEVLSRAEHSKSHQLVPYIVKQDFKKGGALFYVADLPFSFNHYESPALILCDLIYDILKEPAPNRPPLALIRLEDISPNIPTDYLMTSIDYLADRKVPFALALIPYYSNIFENPMTGRMHPIWKPVDSYPDFRGILKYAKTRGASFVMHGVAHQAGDLISGFSGGTGSDYEFWSWPGDRPHPDDRASWVIRRIETAESVFNRLRIKPTAWEVPHYAGSALDFVLFGRLFEWNYHRGLYFKSEILNPTRLSPREWFFYCQTGTCRIDREVKAEELRVVADYRSFGSEIFPYPIYQDSYGQSIIPESIGMVDFPFYRSDTWRPVTTTEDLLRRARKLRVIRGAMASFFWHPIILDPTSVYYHDVPGSFEAKGGIKTLDTLVSGLRNLGYQFTSIDDCRWFPRRDCKGMKP